jgi:NADH dehydrogenase
MVIVGAGFGGLECARRLNRAAVDVLLLDRGGYHLFTPLLYQVTTALLNPAAHQARRDAYPTGRTRTRR